MTYVNNPVFGGFMLENESRVNIGERVPYPFDDMSACGMVSSDEAMLIMATKFYHDNLNLNERAKKYLIERSIFNDQVINHFNLGFADRTLGLRLQKLDKSEEEVSRGSLLRLGLLKSSGHELFYGAITFPILNQERQMVGCYGRRITPKLGSKSFYYVHWKTSEAGFFNVQALQVSESIICCKNPIDALSWWVNGFTNVVSTISGHDFAKSHVAMLQACAIKCIYLAMGTTESALIEARRIAKLLKKQRITVFLVLYPNGLDANSFILQSNNPQEGLQQLLTLSHRYVVN